MSSEPLIQVVDEHDKPLGGASRQEIWKKGYWHRIVRIMVEDKNGRILLQLRSKNTGSYEGCWDDSAAGHVDEGEEYLTAAKRELKEELGISVDNLKEIGRFKVSYDLEWRKINRFNRVYKVVVDNFDTNHKNYEVDAVKWFTLQEIKDFIKNHPKKVTDGLVQVIEKYY